MGSARLFCAAGSLAINIMDGDGVNQVHKMQLWKDRVEGELKASAEWEGAWGFLKAPRPGQKMLKPPSSRSTPSLGTAGKAALQPATQKIKTSQKSATERINAYDFMDDRMRVTTGRKHQTPKERYGRPITIAHDHGW